MSSDSRPDPLSWLAGALESAIGRIRSAILLYGIAVVILLVVLLGLRPELAQDLLPFFWIVWIESETFLSLDAIQGFHTRI